MSHQKQVTLSVDFDGVIRDVMTGEEVPNAKRAMAWLESKGINIVISTANADLTKVITWLNDHDFHYPVTDKKVAATAYIDDRAIRFVSWNDITSYY